MGCGYHLKWMPLLLNSASRIRKSSMDSFEVLFVAYSVAVSTLIISYLSLSSFYFFSFLAFQCYGSQSYIFYSFYYEDYQLSYCFPCCYTFLFLPLPFLFPFMFPSIPYIQSSSSCSSRPILPSFSMSYLSLASISLNFSLFCSSISRIVFILKPACRVLFLRMKHILSRPSHSKQSMLGRGFLGSMRTIELSTLGGGLKLLRPTLIRWSTRANSCTLTLSLQ